MGRGAFGDTVEDVGQVVGGPGLDVLGAGLGLIVERRIGSKTLDIVKVVR